LSREVIGMEIEVRHVMKRFGSFTALQDVSLRIPSGALVALLGPSGSGKTTLLRIIAGLEVPDAGQVLFDGEDVTGRHARDRRVGFVFQHYALFRHMTVFENIAFGLRVRPRSLRPSEAEIRRRVEELLHLVRLEGLADRYPHELSGGQRQRVALARALAVEPRVLLLDEPFASLDARVRMELRRWLRRLHDRIGLTSVFVTHDQEEALELADRVAIFHGGRIEQVGTPEEVYEHPATPFVCGFLGQVNLFHGRVRGGRVRIGTAEVDAPAPTPSDGARVVAYARPHEIDVTLEGGDGTHLAGLVRRVLPLGPLVRLEVDRLDGGEPVAVELGRDAYETLDVREGGRVFLRLRRLRIFADDRKGLDNSAAVL